MTIKHVDIGVEAAADEARKIAIQLLKEGGRGAVLLGAARLDYALERLLKAVMHPHVGGDDNLFDPDRPLGTFSAKISLAYRLGLIEKPVENALQMIRKVRNDFAHSFGDTNLAEQTYQNRLATPYTNCRTNPLWDSLQPIFESNTTTPRELRDFICLVVILVSFMEAATHMQIPFKPTIQVRIKKD